MQIYAPFQIAFKCEPHPPSVPGTNVFNSNIGREAEESFKARKKKKAMTDDFL